MFVNASANGNESGDSWENAFTDLSEALYEANPNTEIWVAQGTYVPNESSSSSNFNIPSSISLYGGFQGTETERTQRDPWLYPTILSGEIGSPGYSDNTEVIVKCHQGEYPGQIVLNGFTIERANSTINAPIRNNGGNLRVGNCIIQITKGGKPQYLW